MKVNIKKIIKEEVSNIVNEEKWTSLLGPIANSVSVIPKDKKYEEKQIATYDDGSIGLISLRDEVIFSPKQLKNLFLQLKQKNII